MKPQFGDNAYEQDRETRAAKIRALFVSGTTIASHTELCIDEDLWTKNELRAKATKACRDEVRAALGDLKDDGLPFAGPTLLREEGAPIWRQEEFWGPEDYIYNYDEYRSRRAAPCVEVANRIADKYRRRFGDGGPRNIQIIEV
jgi:hypothetical protein